MKISFDLDDLLICGVKKFDVEKSNFFTQVLGIENLRLGTVSLFKTLRLQNHEIYIYTTSLRSPFRIWLTFKLKGISLSGIVNKTIHDKKMKKLSFSCSKYPPMFDIDLHIDDSDGVNIESEKYNFNTLIIKENDIKWTETVLLKIGNSS